MPTETGPHGAGHTTNTEALEALLQEKAQKEPVPGLSVAVVKGNRIVWEQGFGFADLTSTLATSSTIYLWFSMTKIVTATAVLRLAEGGNAYGASRRGCASKWPAHHSDLRTGRRGRPSRRAAYPGEEDPLRRRRPGPSRPPWLLRWPALWVN